MTTNSIVTTNTTSSGRIFITGQRTGGLDTGALIEAAYQQKLQPATTIDTRVEQNTAKSQGYVELRSLASAVSTSLANLQAVGIGATNAFDLKTGTVTSSTGNTSPVSVAIDATAQLGTFTVETLSVAQNMVVTSASQASNTDPLGLDGEFSLGVQGGASANITVTVGMNLTDIANAINAEEGTTGVRASVLQVAPNQYQLVLETVDPAQTIQTSVVAGSDVLLNLGVNDGVGGFSNVVQAGTQAQIRYNGVLVARDSNDFSDLLTGIDITVNAADIGNVLTINVEEDATDVRTAITDFVAAYNELQSFISRQQTVSPVEGAGAEEGTVLFADNTMKSLSRDITSILNSIANPGGTDINTLGDVGIQLNAIGQLEVDASVLDAAIINNYDEVRSLFQSTVTVTGAGDQANIVTNNYSGPNLDFVMDVTTDGAGTILDVSVGGDNSLFTINGNSIIGAPGGPYAGLTFAYLGDASVSLNISVNSGISDRLAGTIDRYTNLENGFIQNEIEQLDETNKKLSEDATRIRERAERYKDNEIERYSKLEAAVAQSKSILNYLEALLGNYNNES